MFFTSILQMYLLASTATADSWTCAEQMQLPDPSPAVYHCLRQSYQRDISLWPRPHIDDDVEWQEMAAMPEHAPAPAENPFTEDKSALGEKLFFDPALSRSGQIACASCHEPDLAFADGRRASFGHNRQAGKRNAPSVVMSGFTQRPFWDGRANSLEEQALIPIEDPVEMAFTLPELLQRINSNQDYRKEFAAVFNTEDIHAEHIGQALATYQRSLARVARNTHFDRFLRGQHNRLTDQQLHGLHLFRTKARCMNCHFGVSLTDDQFHNVGLTYYQRKYHDAGLFEVTGQAADMGRFRTPSLRLVSRTGPWFHNGLFPGLDGVLNLYNAGMPRPAPSKEQEQDPLFPQTSDKLRKLELTTEELQALRSFLESL